MDVICGSGFCSVNEALAAFVASAVSVAVMVRELGVGGKVGAVYKPAAEIVPTVVLPPAAPSTDHVTVDEPLPLTVKDCVAPPRNVPVAGATANTAGAGCVGPVPLLPPLAQPARKTAIMPFAASPYTAKKFRLTAVSFA
jgi:hypothetical protein